MKRTIVLPALLLAASLGFATASPAVELGGASRPTAPAAAKPALQAFSAKLAPELRNAALQLHALDVMDANVLKAEDQARWATGDKSLRIGVPRDLRVQMTDGRWDPMPEGGWLWRSELVSKGAYAMRVHFTLMNLPARAQIVFYSSGDQTHVFGPLTGRGPSGDGDFWARAVAGDHVTIEYFSPGEQVPQGNPFQIDQVMHDYVDPLSEAGSGLDKVGTCHNDVTCFPAYASLSHAVGRIDYVQGGSFICTGELLNDFGGDFQPYFLTANHCINTVGGANSATIYWDYQTSSCGGSPPALNTVPTSSYCSLLSNNASSDYCLLMVEGTLPGDAYWSGWDSGGQPDGQAVASIHHPGGDFKRISFGNKSSTTGCGGANHIRSNWYSGVTEPGSSGSGLYRQDNQRLVGQLHCGPSFCGAPVASLNDDYGAFSVTYGSISGFLAGGSDDGFEPNDVCASATGLGSGTYNGLIVRYAHDDWYNVFVAHNQRISLTINFTHAWGDIDMAMYDGCGGSQVAGSFGTGDQEQIDYENLGPDTNFKIHVYLFSDTRNYYNMTINVAALPNLNATFTPGGFSSPAVPRKTNDATLFNAVLPATLDGNTYDTYLNWAIQNEGPGNTPQGWESRLLLDDDPSVYGVFGIGPNNPGFFSWQALNVGPVAMRGGRHSFTNIADYNNTVPESNESDNVWRGQWVWSPLLTTNTTPLDRPHAPLPDYAYFANPNNDGFQFNRPGSNAWVVGIAGTNATDDCDLDVYSDYSSSTAGFSTWIGGSALGGDFTDFVVGHFLGTPTTVYAGAHHFNGGGDFLMDQSYSTYTSAPCASFLNRVMDVNRLVDVYEGFFNSGTTYYLQLLRSDGTSDIAFNVYDGTAGGVYGRFGALAYSTPVNPAGDQLSFTAVNTGWHPIVVYRNEGTAADNAITYSLIWCTSPIVGVDNSTPPLTLEFEGVRPNPMFDNAELAFTLPHTGPVKLEVFDLGGRKVKSLVSRELAAGRHSEFWNGRADDGSRVGAGLYWARFEAEGRSIARRITVLH